MNKEITIECTGYSIAADWYEGKNTQNVLLVLPGYTSTKQRQQDFIHHVLERTDMSIVAIDYSGHGDSPFELENTRPAQHLIEVVTAYDWIKNTHAESVISVAGSSYGGFLGAHLSKYRNIKNLILRAPALYKPANFYDAWGVRLKNEQQYRKDINAFRLGSNLRLKSPVLTEQSYITGKTLVVVHDNDVVVPKTTTDAYIHAFKAEEYIAKGFAHAVSQSEVSQKQIDDYYTYIGNWLSQNTL